MSDDFLHLRDQSGFRAIVEECFSFWDRKRSKVVIEKCWRASYVNDEGHCRFRVWSAISEDDARKRLQRLIQQLANTAHNAERASIRQMYTDSKPVAVEQIHRDARRQIAADAAKDE